jgi:hypothetical protein
MVIESGVEYSVCSDLKIRLIPIGKILTPRRSGEMADAPA